MNKFICILVPILFTMSCNEKENDTTIDYSKIAKIGAFSLYLDDRSEQCELVYHAPFTQGRFALKLSPPCDFHRDYAGNIRVMKYGEAQILLVESSLPDPKHPEDCDTQIQGVKIIDRRVMVSPEVSFVATCPPFQWDEKMFKTFAE